MNIKRRLFSLSLFFILLAGMLSGCAPAAEPPIDSLADFSHATIGIMTGSVYDDLAKEHFPEAERRYYTLMPDLILATDQGKVDGFISERPYCIAALWEGANIDIIDEAIYSSSAGFVFQKGDASAALRAQMNEFIRQSRENGLIDELTEKWLSPQEPAEHPDHESLRGENGVLRVAISPDLKPICYIKDGKASGYEVELLTEFARTYGYGLDLISLTFEAVLPGITAGKYDIAAGGFTITEERSQSVDFSESHNSVEVVMAVKAASSPSSYSGFWDNVKDGFEKTFLREDRWKLIAEGIGVTILISLCSIAAGSLLGFGLYLLSRSESALVRALSGGVAKVYSRIIAGTPVVVILMILFYVVFGRARNLSGVPVAILGFTLIFGAFVFSHMTVAVGSVDKGQTEAAYALGYTGRHTFFRIIFPQAMTVFLPSYCAQAVELVKATAVVGYVAVNDLTKMGDIIRSNTYEAFFPLIATAALYFLLTWLLSLLLNLLSRRFEPERRKADQILKGVDKT